METRTRQQNDNLVISNGTNTLAPFDSIKQLIQSNTLSQFCAIKKLMASPHRYDFFQAIRILYRTFHEHSNTKKTVHNLNKKNNLNSDTIKLENEIKYRSTPGFQFSPSALTRIGYLESNNELLIVEQSMMALAGQSGVLPDHLTELMLQRLDEKDHTLCDFFDLFNNHLIHLFVKTWRKSHFFINYEIDKNQIHYDTTLSLLLAITGQSRFGLEHQNIAPESLVYYSGLLSKKTRSAEGLELILKDYFELPIQVQPFSGKWIEINKQDCTQLGRKKQYNQLGLNTMIGRRIWHVQNSFEIKIGPLHYDDFERLLPVGDMLKALDELAKFYCGIELQFSIRLYLYHTEIPKLQLRNKKPLCLGWNSWLKTKKKPRKTVNISINSKQ